MSFTAGKIKGLWIFEPRIFEDERGYFFESFSQKVFQEATGFDRPFIQDNQSFSKYGVLRGLHFQAPPFEQAKLVRVVRGELMDVVVDIRKDSPTYGHHETVILSAENKKQFFIPSGFAHGIVVLSDFAELLYKCDNYYNPQAESGVLFNDSDLAIDWKTAQEDLIISPKDLALKPLRELPSIF